MIKYVHIFVSSPCVLCSRLFEISKLPLLICNFHSSFVTFAEEIKNMKKIVIANF